MDVNIATQLPDVKAQAIANKIATIDIKEMQEWLKTRSKKDGKVKKRWI